MPVSRQEASEALEDFKREYTGLSQVKYVLLENKKDFHDHYGPNAERAVQAWAGKLGAYSRSTRTIALALAAYDDKSEIAATLAHEGIGHSGINTFSGAEKRGLIDALIESKKHPGALRDSYWKAVEDAYPIPIWARANKPKRFSASWLKPFTPGAAANTTQKHLTTLGKNQSLSKASRCKHGDSFKWSNM